MLQYILDYLFPKYPFEIQKPIKYVTQDEYVSLTPRQKKLLHSRYELYLYELHYNKEIDNTEPENNHFELYEESTS